MAFGGPDTKRELMSWAGLLTRLAESVGLLNKGSSKQQAAPSDVSDVQPISSNSLNVTRVGGLSSLIAAAGGAALLLFKVNKTKDPAPVVVAAYASTGVIVAAALITAALIIMADIRARAAIAVTPSPKIGPRQSDINHVQAVPTQAANGAQLDYIAPLDRAYEYVLIDAHEANVVLTLPSTSAYPWQRMVLVRADTSGNRVTIRPQGQQQLLGEAEQLLAAHNSIRIYSDGQAWHSIAA